MSPPRTSSDPHGPPDRRSITVVGATAVAIVLLAAAACGGSDSGSASAAQPEGTGSDEDAQALAFAECMRDNGVDMPDPGPGQEGLGNAFQSAAEGVDEETMGEAMAACEELMPQYASDEMHNDDELMLDLAECLREQGLDVSDNPFTDMHAGEIDQSELSAAMQVCRDALTGGGQ